ncbi:hypothetical protein MTBPR1_30037 [Candidatus Terasakiella magnetica]|uniref:KfrA N-terminal DNA-binding domain-containing protein n=1 Tax=Candidatus Terasakiella magnetica TaxID=1867952 RepID=A0A1C3RHA8_9PROT|nr:hypothetical protein [Candidatus Terasakiella magnetica]SCA56667.1 hypothetical protein MTBPR1_30037 [Candidatus Terasakiella magnetica]
MPHSTKTIIDMLNKENHEKCLALPHEQIKHIVYGAEKLSFDENLISVRSIRSVLKDEGISAGENKQLGVAVKSLVQIIQKLNAQKKIDEENLLEAVLPLQVTEKFEQLAETYAASLKEVRFAAAEAIKEQNTKAFAQMNQSVGLAAAEYEERIKRLHIENDDLRKQVEEQSEAISSGNEERQQLTVTVQSLESEVDILKEQVSGKDKAEKEVERLLGRLDVYESFPKPTAPRRSSSTKK